MTAHSDALELYAQRLWQGGTPLHLAALGVPASGQLDLAAFYVAQRRQMANGAVRGGIKAVALPAAHPEQWLKVASGQGSVLKVGFLVCSTALRGADMQTLKSLLVSAGPKGKAGSWQAVVYDWCTVGLKSGLLKAQVPSAKHKNAQATQVEEEEEDDDDAVMSVMEELAAEKSDLTFVAQGTVGFEASELAAKRINADGVHVLATLDGWNGKNRNSILFHRPAPVQVAALGHRGSMGDAEGGVAALVDAMVGGRVSTPPEHAPHFGEGLVVLPLGYMPPCPTRLVPGTQPPQYTSLPETFWLSIGALSQSP